MKQPLNDYTGRCGGCKYFAFHVRKDKLLRWGFCELRRKTSHQASQIACKKYEDYDEKE